MRGDPRIVNTETALEEALKGAEIMYKAVAVAYGPTSRNVALQKSYGNHVITHDGVTIAKDIVLRDQDKNVGGEQLYTASNKSDSVSGDGTTNTILLGYHVLNKAYQRVAAKYNPMALRRGIDWAGSRIIKELDKLAVPVEDKNLHEVATISAADPEVGKLVADTILKAAGVGITIEEHDGLGVLQDIIEGLYFEKGYSMPHFANDLVAEQAVHENTHVICLEKRVRDNQDIIPILKMLDAESDHKSLLIIGNLSDRALGTCVATHLKGGIRICVVTPPVYANQRLPFLEDIATMTGGKVVAEDMPASKVTKDFLGFAKKVVVGRETTTIMEGRGDPEQVQIRIDTLSKQMAKETNPYIKERMEKRMSKLRGRIGIIRVGGATEEIKEEMKFRVTDAVHAARGAHEDGIVAGGAVTLARLSKTLLEQEDFTKELNKLPRDEQEGAHVVLESLQEPFRQLMANTGIDPGYRLEQVLRAKDGYGFDVKNMTKEPINLMKAGIIDPVRVIKSAVENGCSVAGLLITLGATTTIDRDFQLEQIQLNRAGIGG